MAKNTQKTLDLRNAKRREFMSNSRLLAFPKHKIRVCIECKVRKKCRWIHSFSQTGKPEYRTRCVDCFKSYARTIRRRRKDTIAARKRGKHKLKKEECVAILGGKCCRCGYKKSTAALTFHHIDPTKKSGDIAKLINKKSWEFVKLELTQCELLCFNCHMEEEEELRYRKMWEEDELNVY